MAEKWTLFKNKFKLGFTSRTNVFSRRRVILQLDINRVIIFAGSINLIRTAMFDLCLLPTDTLSSLSAPSPKKVTQTNIKKKNQC